VAPKARSLVTVNQKCARFLPGRVWRHVGRTLGSTTLLQLYTLECRNERIRRIGRRLANLYERV